MANRSIRDNMQQAPPVRMSAPVVPAVAPVARPQPLMQPPARMPQQPAPIINGALPQQSAAPGVGTLNPALTAPVLPASAPSPAARPAVAIANPGARARPGGIVGTQDLAVQPGARPLPMPAPMPVQGATGPGTGSPGAPPMSGIGTPPLTPLARA